MDSYMKKFLKLKQTSKYFFSVETQLQYLKHLQLLMVNGYSFHDALTNMVWDLKYVAPSETIKKALKKGRSVDQAFAEANFHESIISYLQFAKHNENLIVSLKNCIDMFEHRVSYIERFKKTLRYPLFLGAVLLILLIGLKQYVLPLFLQLFHGQSSSSKTVMLSISFIEFLTTLIIICFLISIIGAVLWRKYKNKLPIETRLQIYTKIPIYRSFLTLHTSYYLVTYVSMYLKASLPMKEVLEQIGKHEKLPILAYYAQQIHEKLGEGNSISSAIEHLYFLDKHTELIFSKGINEKNLEKDLSVYAMFLGEKLRNNMGKLIQWIQPVAFTSIAIFIVFVYVTLMLPMYQLIQTI